MEEEEGGGGGRRKEEEGGGRRKEEDAKQERQLSIRNQLVRMELWILNPDHFDHSKKKKKQEYKPFLDRDALSEENERERDNNRKGGSTAYATFPKKKTQHANNVPAVNS